MADQPPSVVVMEACGSAHYWAREMVRLGHDVKLIALRAVLYEYGHAAPKGIGNIKRIDAKTKAAKEMAATADTARLLQMMPLLGHEFMPCQAVDVTIELDGPLQTTGISAPKARFSSNFAAPAQIQTVGQTARASPSILP